MADETMSHRRSLINTDWIIARIKEVPGSLDTPCWEWQRYRNKDGYGKYCTDGRVQNAHRTSYKLFIGSIPDGLNVLHRCDNPPCVNPQHLFVGTQADNNTDCKIKGRRPRLKGELNKRSKLTEVQVILIRSLPKKVPNTEIARQFNVADVTISNIRARRTWKHI